MDKYLYGKILVDSVVANNDDKYDEALKSLELAREMVIEAKREREMRGPIDDLNAIENFAVAN